MNSEEASQWSRHIDSLLWHVTSLFVAAIGGLLAYSYSNFDVAISVSGLFLSSIPVYFGASFRELRKKVNEHLDDELIKILSEGRKLFQWKLYVLIFMILELLWVNLLIREKPNQWVLWALMGILVLVITTRCASIGKSVTSNADA